MLDSRPEDRLERHEMRVFDGTINEVVGRAHSAEVPEKEEVSLPKPLTEGPLLQVNQVRVV